MSAKRTEENREYSILRAKFLTSHPDCEACRMLHPRRVTRAKSIDVHHMQGRGPNLNRIETWAAVCRKCHTEIHEDMKNARKLGLAL